MACSETKLGSDGRKENGKIPLLLKKRLGGGFNYLIFTLTWGNDPILKPPTRRGFSSFPTPQTSRYLSNQCFGTVKFWGPQIRGPKECFWWDVLRLEVFLGGDFCWSPFSVDIIIVCNSGIYQKIIRNPTPAPVNMWVIPLFTGFLFIPVGDRRICHGTFIFGACKPGRIGIGVPQRSSLH